MNTGMIPSRYAKALYEYAGEKSATERVYGEMQRLAGSFAAEPALRRALDNPVLTPEQKSGLVYNAAGGDPSDELKRFVELVLSHKRMQLLHRMALDYMALYRRAHNISTGELQTAVAVDETTEQRTAQEQAFKEKLYRDPLTEFTTAAITKKLSVNPSARQGSR